MLLCVSFFIYVPDILEQTFLEDSDLFISFCKQPDLMWAFYRFFPSFYVWIDTASDCTNQKNAELENFIIQPSIWISSLATRWS